MRRRLTAGFTVVAFLVGSVAHAEAPKPGDIALDGRAEDRFFFEVYGGPLQAEGRLTHRVKDGNRLVLRDVDASGGYGGLRMSWHANDYAIVDIAAMDIGTFSVKPKTYDTCTFGCPNVEEAYSFAVLRAGAGGRVAVPLRYVQPYFGLHASLQVVETSGKDPADPNEAEAPFRADFPARFGVDGFVGTNVYLHREWRLFVDLRQSSLDGTTAGGSKAPNRLSFDGAHTRTLSVGVSASPSFFRKTTPGVKAATVGGVLGYAALMGLIFAAGAKDTGQ